MQKELEVDIIPSKIQEKDGKIFVELPALNIDDLSDDLVRISIDHIYEEIDGKWEVIEVKNTVIKDD